MKTLLEFDYKKATQAINYLSKKEGGQIDKLKLMKLIYFADRFHLRKYGRPIFNDTYYAMPKGPVASSVKDIAELSSYLAEDEKNYAVQFISVQKNAVSSLKNVDENVFSQSDIEALDFAHNEFGAYKPLELVDFTHKYPEWQKHEGVLKSKETTREPMTYADFFKDPKDMVSDKFVANKEVLEASKELFEDNFKIAEYWK